MRGAWFAVRFTRFGALERRDDVAGEDGTVRTRAERGRTRPLVTRFGQVSVSRIACRSPGRGNVHPLDAALNLPQEKHSHGLRKLAALEAARGSMEAAGAAITRATGVRLGKRQVEELARRCAAHVEAFCAQRAIDPAPEGWPLILTFDGKRIVMLPGALRPATAKAAASAEGKLATGLSSGEKHGRKRMAELACVYDAAPVPRAPQDVIGTPRRNGGRGKRRPRPRRRKASRGTRALEPDRWQRLGEAGGSHVGEQPVLHVAAIMVGRQVPGHKHRSRPGRQLGQGLPQLSCHRVLPLETPLTAELQQVARPRLDAPRAVWIRYEVRPHTAGLPRHSASIPSTTHSRHSAEHMALRVGSRHSGGMPVTVSGIAAALARYARSFHQVAGDGHHVASPLGAWLLLALAGPACGGDDLRQLTQIVGVDADAAAGFAAELLRHPHPAVHAGAAVWGGSGPAAGARIASWREGLPPLVDTGPVPAQADLDAWVRRHTKGKIDRFPVEGGAAVTWLLATALATRLSWQRPFHLAAASALGPASPWAVTLTRVLRTPGGPGNRRVPGHDQFIAATDTAGEVAVHAVSARDGLMVVSVAAAPQVPASVVLSASYDVGTALATGRPLTRRSLFDLPLGDGAAWTITQEHAGPWQATQAAMARYSRTGFEAAAVTALAVAVSAPKLKPGIRRTAELRFGHPFAVVAVTTSDRAPHARHPPEPPGPWHGLPVFSAWVASPEDATAEPTSTS